MRVDLFHLDQMALVIEARTGVTYSNQAAGHACAHPELEGILIPFGNDPPLANPEMSLTAILSELLVNVMHLDERWADAIDRVLAASTFTRIASVDRTRLHDSMEAWVHVVVDFTQQPFWRSTVLRTDETIPPIVSGHEHARGVLVWPNSD